MSATADLGTGCARRRVVIRFGDFDSSNSIQKTHLSARHFRSKSKKAFMEMHVDGMLAGRQAGRQRAPIDIFISFTLLSFVVLSFTGLSF